MILYVMLVKVAKKLIIVIAFLNDTILFGMVGLPTKINPKIYKFPNSDRFML